MHTKGFNKKIKWLQFRVLNAKIIKIQVFPNMKNDHKGHGRSHKAILY